jgi:hypothetical protein
LKKLGGLLGGAVDVDLNRVEFSLGLLIICDDRVAALPSCRERSPDMIEVTTVTRSETKVVLRRRDFDGSV